MWVPSLGQEDPLEKEMVTTPGFLPGKPHRQRSLRAMVHGVAKESDMTQQVINTNVVDIFSKFFRATTKLIWINVMCPGPSTVPGTQQLASNY